MKKNISIHLAQKDEIPELINWFTDNYYHDREQAEKHFADHIDQDGATFVAKENNQLVGYVTVGISYTKKIPLIANFYVAEGYRRMGLGTRLLDLAEEYIAKNLGDRVVLWVPILDAFGPAQIMYIKRGYVPDGRGVVTDNTPVKAGDKVTISDEFHWCLEKEL